MLLKMFQKLDQKSPLACVPGGEMVGVDPDSITFLLPLSKENAGGPKLVLSFPPPWSRPQPNPPG